MNSKHAQLKQLLPRCVDDRPSSQFGDAAVPGWIPLDAAASCCASGATQLIHLLRSPHSPDVA